MASSYSIHPPTEVLVDSLSPLAAAAEGAFRALSPTSPADTSPLSSAPNSPVASFDNETDTDTEPQQQPQLHNRRPDPIAFSIHNHHRFLSSTPERRSAVEEKKSEDEQDDRPKHGLKRSMLQSSWNRLQERKHDLSVVGRSSSVVSAPPVTASVVASIPPPRRTSSLPFEDEMDEESAVVPNPALVPVEKVETITHIRDDDEEDLPEDERLHSRENSVSTSHCAQETEDPEDLQESPTDEALLASRYRKQYEEEPSTDLGHDDEPDEWSTSGHEESPAYEALLGAVSLSAAAAAAGSIAEPFRLGASTYSVETQSYDEDELAHAGPEEEETEPADERRVDRRQSLQNGAMMPPVVADQEGGQAGARGDMGQSESYADAGSDHAPVDRDHAASAFRPAAIDTYEDEDLGATRDFIRKVQESLSNLGLEPDDSLKVPGSPVLVRVDDSASRGAPIWREQRPDQQSLPLEESVSHEQEPYGQFHATEATPASNESPYSPGSWSLQGELAKRRAADRNSDAASSEQSPPKRDPDGVLPASSIDTPSKPVIVQWTPPSASSLDGSQMDKFSPIRAAEELFDPTLALHRSDDAVASPITEPPVVRRLNVSLDQDPSFESMVKQHVQDDEPPSLFQEEPPSLRRPPLLDGDEQRSSAYNPESRSSSSHLADQPPIVPGVFAVPDAAEPDTQFCLGGILLTLRSLSGEEATDPTPASAEAEPLAPKQSREATDPDGQTNGMPASVYALNNDIGVPKGDIIISLLNESAETTWSDRVREGILRGRTMRQCCNTRWLQDKLARRPEDVSRGRTSIQVDVDDARVVGGVHNLSNTQIAAVEHLKFDDFDDALALYEDVLESYNNAFEDLFRGGSANANDARVETLKSYIGAALHNIGIIHLLRGEHQHAFAYFERAVMNRASCLGNGHPSYLASLVKLAVCQISLKDFAKAQASLEEALLSSSDQPESIADYRQLAEILNNLGCLAHVRGEAKKAMKFFHESIEVQKTASEFSLYDGSKFSSHSISLCTSVTVANIGFLGLVSKDTQVCISSFETAVQDQQLLLRDAHVTLTTTMDYLVVANLVGGRKENAVRILRRMLHMQIDAFGPNDVRTLVTSNKLDTLLKEHEEPDDAGGTSKKNKLSLFRSLKPRRKKK